MVTFNNISADEYPAYYQPYLNLIDPSLSLFDTLENSLYNSLNLLKSIEVPLSYRYAPNKWSIGQVMMHNIDTERVFAYRALCFMRGDPTSLPSFDQDLFVDNLGDLAFAKADVLQSLKTTRDATIELFKNASDVSLIFKGTASDKIMTPRVIPFIIVGHNLHHEKIIRERYLVGS
ncbi:MAG: hypothetical protein ACJAXY_001214 [Nonlabens sp.]|jgi:hypothetical protein|uniref:DinB family protein n=1 Tax=Nonlabens sp. TaxID=1888209 RepID=UPI0039E6D6D2